VSPRTSSATPPPSRPAVTAICLSGASRATLTMLAPRELRGPGQPHADGRLPRGRHHGTVAAHPRRTTSPAPPPGPEGCGENTVPSHSSWAPGRPRCATAGPWCPEDDRVSTGIAGAPQPDPLHLRAAFHVRDRVAPVGDLPTDPRPGVVRRHLLRSLGGRAAAPRTANARAKRSSPRSRTPA
jgi:hypothetical protein